jgi:hypothetical protein
MTGSAVEVDSKELCECQRVLVCGGRNFSEVDYLYEELDKLNISCLIQGGATGADALAFTWAISRGIKTEMYKADWAKNGRAAGPIRNLLMLKEGKPDLVVAFHGGNGTAHMVKIAKEHKIPVKDLRISGLTVAR